MLQLVPTDIQRIMTSVISLSIEPEFEFQVCRRDDYSHGKLRKQVFLSLTGPLVPYFEFRAQDFFQIRLQCTELVDPGFKFASTTAICLA